MQTLNDEDRLRRKLADLGAAMDQAPETHLRQLDGKGRCSGARQRLVMAVRVAAVLLLVGFCVVTYQRERPATNVSATGTPAGTTRGSVAPGIKRGPLPKGPLLGVVEENGRRMEMRAAPGVTVSFIPSGSKYAKAIGRILNLKHVNAWRTEDPGPDGKPFVVDQVNRTATTDGYQASIYHRINPEFAKEHDAAKYPTIETPVGRAWYTQLPSASTVTLVNERTGIIVRVIDLPPHLLPHDTVIAKAIELSSDPTVVQEAKRH